MLTPRFSVSSLLAFFLLALCLSSSPAVAQTSTNVEVRMKNGTESEAAVREQVQRLLQTHDLDPWIFTQTVQIEDGVIPHSHPVLTLGTGRDRLNDDAKQLGTFIHEQVHWMEGSDAYEDRVAAVIEDLKAAYPNPPGHEEIGTRSEHSTYLHLFVCWMELDGIAELFGEEKGRSIFAEKHYYEWVYERVLEDTDAIGRLIAENDLLITPDAGLVVSTGQQSGRQ